MLCEWMKTNYLKRYTYCGQTLEVNEDVVDLIKMD